MVKRLAQVFGVVLLLVGILGFIPGVTTEDGLLLGIFQVNAAHNIVHILTGLVGLWAASSGYASSKVFLQVFGVVYALVAILGFVYGDEPILGFIASNMADTWLHVVIALVALYGGFVASEDAAA